jgi:hypothetical protein
MGQLRKLKKRRQQQAMQRVIDASERVGLYDQEVSDIAHLWSRSRLPVVTVATTMTPDQAVEGLMASWLGMPRATDKPG